MAPVVAVRGRLAGRGQRREARAQIPGPCARRAADQCAAVLIEKLLEPGPIDPRGIEGRERLRVALLPVLDEVVEQDRGPADAAFEDGEVDPGQAPRRAAQEERLDEHVHALGEGADVVERVVRDRRERERDVAEAGVEGHGEPERASAPPDRVVVVGAVESEAVEPGPLAGHQERARLVVGLGDRAHHALRKRDDLEALRGAVIEGRERLLWRVHRDDAGDRQAIGVRSIGLGVEGVEAAADALPELVVVDPGDPEALRRIEDRVVDAELGESLVEQRRQDGGREVARVLRRRRPPRALRRPRREPPRRIGVHDPCERRLPRLPALEEPRTERLAEERQHRGHVLEHMPVGVDHGMAEPTTDLAGLQFASSRSEHYRDPRVDAPRAAAHRRAVCALSDARRSGSSPPRRPAPPAPRRRSGCAVP